MIGTLSESTFFPLKLFSVPGKLSFVLCFIFIVLFTGAELGPEWQCANRTTLVSKQECSDFLNSCHTLLDLTGPLQLGALPAAASGQTQINIPPLDGCIRYEFTGIVIGRLEGFKP